MQILSGIAKVVLFIIIYAVHYSDSVPSDLRSLLRTFLIFPMAATFPLRCRLVDKSLLSVCVSVCWSSGTKAFCVAFSPPFHCNLQADRILKSALKLLLSVGSFKPNYHGGLGLNFRHSINSTSYVKFFFCQSYGQLLS